MFAAQRASPRLNSAPLHWLQIKKLQSVEAGVKDKIIDFDMALFEELAASPGRPYSLVFFCSAESKMDSPQLQLRALRKEFALTADVSICLERDNRSFVSFAPSMIMDSKQHCIP